MFAGSVARLLVKRSTVQAQQTALASYIGSGAFAALSAVQKADLQAQNNRALGKITTMTARVKRKTGHT